MSDQTAIEIYLPSGQIPGERGHHLPYLVLLSDSSYVWVDQNKSARLMAGNKTLSGWTIDALSSFWYQQKYQRYKNNLNPVWNVNSSTVATSSNKDVDLEEPAIDKQFKFSSKNTHNCTCGAWADGGMHSDWCDCTG